MILVGFLSSIEAVQIFHWIQDAASAAETTKFDAVLSKASRGYTLLKAAHVCAVAKKVPREFFGKAS